MKHIKIVFAVMLVFTLCTAFTMKSHKPVYAFGVAASFNDSVVYCTEIQVLDSTALDKNGFLPKRDLYSYQLKNYLEYDLKNQFFFRIFTQAAVTAYAVCTTFFFTDFCCVNQIQSLI